MTSILAKLFAIASLFAAFACGGDADRSAESVAQSEFYKCVFLTFSESADKNAVIAFVAGVSAFADERVGSRAFNDNRVAVQVLDEEAFNSFERRMNLYDGAPYDLFAGIEVTSDRKCSVGS